MVRGFVRSPSHNILEMRCWQLEPSSN